MKTKTEELLETANTESHSSVSFAKRTFPDDVRAGRVFAALKEKILNIDEWNKNSTLSSFQLFNEQGGDGGEKLAEGVFNRISLKGSGKYDWVKVVEIDESPEELVIMVKPTYDPTAEKPDPEIISHFFGSDSSNNFCLLKHEHSVALYVIGLNEKENTAETKNTIETLRNFAAANLGSYLGIQKGEWESFCHEFLSNG